MGKKKKNTNALDGSVDKELNDKKLMPGDQQEHEHGCTSNKTTEPCGLVGTEATLRGAQTQEYPPKKRRSSKKKKDTKNPDCSGISNDGRKESSSVDVTALENEEVVKSVADSVIPTQGEPVAMKECSSTSSNKDNEKALQPQKVSTNKKANTESSASVETLSTSSNRDKVNTPRTQTASATRTENTEASTSKGGSVPSLSDRLQDLDLEEPSTASDGGTVDELKKVGPTGKLSDQGEAKIFAAVNDVGTKVMQAVFQTIFFEREIKGQEVNTIVTLDQWFKKYEFRSNKKIKDKLGGQYCKNVTDPLTTKYDIQFYTFAFDLYHMKCPRLLEGSKEHLNKVKNFRDKLCHRGLLYTCEKATLNTLEREYVAILKNVAARCDNETYTQPVLNSVRKLMAHIKKTDRDLGNFEKVKELFLRELRPKFINAAQEELATNVQRNSTNPFYWIHDDKHTNFKFALNDVYCDPWLVGGDERLNVPKLLLFPERGVPPPLLMLVGDGATGKTTLCHKMFSQWQGKHENEPTFIGLKNFDLVLLFELRNINDTSLVKYLEHTLSKTLKNTIHINDLLELLQDLDVLYIIDGFDEKDEGGRNVKLVKDIAKNLSNKSRVLLTTRSEYQKEATHLFPSVKSDFLDLKGLDQKGQTELSFNLINVLRKGENCKELHEQFGDFLKKRSNVFLDRLRIPLVMDLLVWLWLEFKDDDSILKEIKSATQLYLHLVDMLKRKLAERLERAAGRGAVLGDTSEDGEHSETNSSKDVKAFPAHNAYLDECAILNSLDQMIMVLSKVAYDHTLADIVDLKLNQTDLCRLRESCSSTRIDDVQFFSAFLIHDVRAKVPQFSFFHRTETDYFSAVFITKDAKKVSKGFDLCRCFPENVGMKKFKETILFIVGCFSIDNVLNRYPSQIMEMVDRAEVDRYDFNFFFRLLVESGSGKNHTLDTDGCKEPLCSQVADYLPMQFWNLKDDTAVAGLRILMHCFHVEISELEIDFPQQVDPDCDENLMRFSDVMEKLKWALKRRFCKEKRNEIELSLHIRHHALEDSTNTSDRYLSYLHPWAKLMKFTGHIGVEASQHLFYFTNLKDLDIRITSVTAYNTFLENCFPRYSRLKKMTMRLCFPPGTVNVPSLLPFPDQGPKSVRTAVRLHFRKVQKKSFDEMINIILQITGRRDGALERVVINSSDLDLVSAETISKKLRSIVCEKVSVSSNTALKDNQLTNIRGAPSSFIFEWNDRNISEALWAGPNPTVVWRGPINTR